MVLLGTRWKLLVSSLVTDCSVSQTNERGAGEEEGSAYLSLDAVEPSEPEDLAAAEFHLGVVNLICALRQLFLVHLGLGDAVAGLLQELEAVCWYGRDELRKGQRGQQRVRLPQPHTNLHTAVGAPSRVSCSETIQIFGSMLSSFPSA